MAIKYHNRRSMNPARERLISLKLNQLICGAYTQVSTVQAALLFTNTNNLP